MSEAKVTLKQMMAIAAARPTTPELELAVLDFLDLSESEQRVLLFREMCHLSGNINWLLAQVRK